MTRLYRFVEFALIAAILFVSAATIARGQPLPRIDVDTFCRQTMSTQPQLVVYSGNLAIAPFQYGFEAVDVVTGREHHRNGAGKTGGLECSSPLLFEGDCWQSVTQLAATPGSPKWIVATGAPNMCGVDGLAVWKWGGMTFDWWGFISIQTDRGSPVYLDGDFAWASDGVFQIPEKWTRYDLNAKTAQGGFSSPIQGPVQRNVQGFTYTIHPIIPNPLPPGWTAPSKFFWQRSDVPIQTETPGPPPAKTSTPGGPTPTWIITSRTPPVFATFTPRPGDCCPQGQVCASLPPCSQLSKTVTRVPTRISKVTLTNTAPMPSPTSTNTFIPAATVTFTPTPVPATKTPVPTPTPGSWWNKLLPVGCRSTRP